MANFVEIFSFYPRRDTDFPLLIETIAVSMLHSGATTVRFAQPTDEDDGVARVFTDWPVHAKKQTDFQDGDDDKIYTACDMLLAKVIRPDKVGTTAADVYQVAVEPFPPTVLDCAIEGNKGQGSKVVEILRAYFPQDAADNDDWKKGIEKQAKAFVDFMASTGVDGINANPAMGWAMEPTEFKGQNCASFVVFVGWDSVEAQQRVKHMPCFQEGIAFIKAMDQLVGVELAIVSNYVTKAVA